MEPAQHYTKQGILYEPVVENIQEWPITRFFKRKKGIVSKVVEEAVAQVHKQGQQKDLQLEEIIAETMFRERNRIIDDPWKVDPKDEFRFWKSIKSDLVLNEQLEGNLAQYNKRNEEMLERVVLRYAEEISSTFRPRTYHFAKRALPFFFSTLLNASAGKTLKAAIYHNRKLQEKVHFLGEIQAIRKLASKGTIVLVPTHISNMDSILVGWCLHALGLPAFIYGAGLNLYNTPILAYFMNRLGAYKVDRRKKNPIYRETLNAYSTLSIQNGVHSLFFPGGTRSRSGMIEKNLKLGLLGTVMEAQRRNFLVPPTTHSGKVFIIPMVMSYHFVLEAATLINQHLTRTGKGQYYIINDEFASYRKFLEFIWQTFSAKSEIAMSFGKPMDIFGNFVDMEGISYDHHGNPLDVSGYFKSKGEITEDAQRDAEYTRMLGTKIVERYHIENHVFSSHIVAYVAFEMIKKRFPKFDLYALLRLPEEERSLPKAEYTKTVERVLKRLRDMSDRGQVFLAQHLNNPVEEIIKHGVKNLGIYHSKRPLTLTKESTVYSENMNLLYYYHNRLEGYGLSAFI